MTKTKSRLLAIAVVLASVFLLAMTNRTTLVYQFVNGFQASAMTPISSDLTMVIGSATAESLTITTNGTGTAEVVVPAGSFSGNEYLASSGAAPAATCSVGELFIDTDETDDTNCTTVADNVICICHTANTWKAIE